MVWLIRSVVLVAIIATSADASAQTAPDPTTHELRSIMDERDARYTQRFNDQEKAVAAALAAAKEAVDKAEGAASKRFDSVNEFRGQLKDQASTLMPRAETILRFATVEEAVKKIEAAQTLANGRSEGVSLVWGIIFAFAGALGTLILCCVAVAGFLMRRRTGGSV